MAHDDEHLSKFEELLEAAVDLEAVPEDYLICATYDPRLQVGLGSGLWAGSAGGPGEWSVGWICRWVWGGVCGLYQRLLVSDGVNSGVNCLVGPSNRCGEKGAR